MINEFLIKIFSFVIRIDAYELEEMKKRNRDFCSAISLAQPQSDTAEDNLFREKVIQAEYQQKSSR